MDPNTMGLPNAGVTSSAVNGGYRCGSNTSSSSGRGSSIQHASLPRHFSNTRQPQQTVASTVENMNSPLSEVPIITNGLPSVSAHIPMQHHNLAYNTANKTRPNYNNQLLHNNSYYYTQRPPLAAPSNGIILQLHPYS